MSMLKKLKNRYTQVGILVFFLFCTMILQLAVLQIKNGVAYSKEADAKRVRTLSISPPRGIIYDRYGRVLAGNRKGYKLQLLVHEAPKEQLNDIILKAVSIVEQCGDEYEDNLLLIRYSPDTKQYDWYSEDLAAWKEKNGIPLESTAAQAYSQLKKQFKIPSSLSEEEAFELTAFRVLINSADPDVDKELTLTEPLTPSDRTKLEKLVEKYAHILSLKEVTEEGKKGYVLDMLPLVAKNSVYNEIGTKLLEIIPSEKLKSHQSLPMVMKEDGRMDWSTRQIRAWKEANKINEDMDAEAAFQYLAKKYQLREDLSPQDMQKIIAIRLAISQLGYLIYNPALIANDISAKTVATIEENSLELPGVVIQDEYIRYYPNGSLLAQSLGYVGKITADRAEEYKKKGYNLSTDLVGRAGLESALEPYLKGTSGWKKVEVNKMGRVVRELDGQNALPGNDVFLTIDRDVQIAAEKSLKDTIKKIQKGEFGEKFPNAKIGAAVAIDVKTGEVIALASYPSYDPNLFATGTIDSKTWKELNPRYPHPDDPNRENQDPTLPRPMLNNAITGTFPPGSTFKMVVGAGGMKEGLVGVTEKIQDKGRYTKFSQKNAPACWIWNDYRGTHGWVDIIDAIRDSCNYYFYEVGTRMGIKKIEAYAKLFGLGDKTGIEIPGESVGIIAGEEFTNRYLTYIVSRKVQEAMKAKQEGELTDEDKEKALAMATDMIEHFSIQNIRKHLKPMGYENNDKIVWEIYSYINDNQWTPGRTLSASIGQGEHSFTVIQMANYIAALANGKSRFKPHIVLGVKDSDGKTLMNKEPEVVGKIDLKSDIHKAILEGMKAATSENYRGRSGTAARFFRDFPIEVGGKTGTAQFKGRDSYAWFVGFAPFDDPQIAVAVMIGQGGHGSYASPVAKDIFAAYLGLNDKKDLQEFNTLEP